MTFGLSSLGIEPPRINVRIAIGEVGGSTHQLTSVVSPEDSVLYDQPGPKCNKRGIMLDNHVGNADKCARCGEQKGRS